MKRIVRSLSLMLVALVSACGKKGDPRAPELATPRSITNLDRATRSPNGVALTWSRPTEYVDGRELKDLASFVIFRKEISPSLSRTARCRIGQLTTVDVEDREKFVQTKTISL